MGSIATATALLAGCSSGATTDTQPTGTNASSGPDTSTARSAAIESVTPIAGWNGSDGSRTETTGFGRGANAIFAAETRSRVGDQGRAAIDATAVVYDETGKQYAWKQRHRQLEQTGGVGTVTWQAPFQFGTDQFSRGQYRLEVSTTDAVSGADLGSASTDFAVREPLDPDEVAVVDKIHPATVSTDESFDYGLRLHNVGDRDSSVVSSQSIKVGDGSFHDVSATFAMNLPVDSIRAITVTDVSIPRPGTYTYRFDALDVTFQVEAEK